MPILVSYNLIFRPLFAGVIWWSFDHDTAEILTLLSPLFLCESQGRGMGDKPWFWSMFVTMLRLHCWCYSSPQLRIKTYKPVMLHQPMWFRLPFKWGKTFLIWYRNSRALFDPHTRCLPCIQLIHFSKFHLVHLTLLLKATHRLWFWRLFVCLVEWVLICTLLHVSFLCLNPHIH